MKVSYIITPSVSTQYLIRCFNSLYRQTNLNFEIILAENRFDEEETVEIETYLSEHIDIKRISPFLESDMEKIKEGLSLISEDTDYMAFLSADTVVAPITTEIVLNQIENAEVVVTSVVLKGKETTFERTIENSLFDVVNSLGLYRVFYGKQAISKFKVEFFENEMEFELYKFHFMVEQQIKCLEQVCFYINIKEIRMNNTIIINDSSEIVEVLEEAIKNNRKEITIEILDYYLSKYSIILEDVEKELETKEVVYEIVKNIAIAIQEDFALSHLFQMYMRCSVTEVQKLDFLSYQIFIEKMMQLSYTGKNPVEILPTLKSTKELQEKQIIKINTLVLNQEQFISSIEELKTNMHYLMKEVTINSNQNSLNFIDPINEIPALFSQGKLGFTVIIKSIKAWITYKIKGKR